MHFKDEISDSWGCAQRINNTNSCNEEVTLVSARVRLSFKVLQNVFYVGKMHC